MSDRPGSYISVLTKLRGRVNFIESVTYATKDGNAVFSAYAEPIPPYEGPDTLKALVMESPAAIDCRVIPGAGGVLVDTFHRGIETGAGEPLILFKRTGVRRMFGRMAKLFGSGGEVMLYDEGLAMGESDGAGIRRSWRTEDISLQFPVLLKLFASFGWGSATSVPDPSPNLRRIRMDDCFECSSRREGRVSCAFVRGFLTGSAGALLRREVACEETLCRLRGAEACEFVLDVRPPSSPVLER